MGMKNGCQDWETQVSPWIEGMPSSHLQGRKGPGCPSSNRLSGTCPMAGSRGGSRQHGLDAAEWFSGGGVLSASTCGGTLVIPEGDSGGNQGSLGNEHQRCALVAKNCLAWKMSHIKDCPLSILHAPHRSSNLFAEGRLLKMEDLRAAL